MKTLFKKCNVVKLTRSKNPLPCYKNLSIYIEGVLSKRQAISTNINNTRTSKFHSSESRIDSSDPRTIKIRIPPPPSSPPPSLSPSSAQPIVGRKKTDDISSSSPGLINGGKIVSCFYVIN